MMQDPRDVAELLARLVRSGTGGEAIASPPRVSAGLVPTQAAFTVETVEGKHFRVIILEERRRPGRWPFPLHRPPVPPKAEPWEPDPRD